MKFKYEPPIELPKPKGKVILELTEDEFIHIVCAVGMTSQLRTREEAPIRYDLHLSDEFYSGSLYSRLCDGIEEIGGRVASRNIWR